MIELVVQVLLERVANRTLRIRTAGVNRHLVHPGDLRGDLRAAQDEADLRPVPVPNRHVPPHLDHIGDVMRRLLRRLVLILNALVLLILNQGIAPNRNHGPFAFAHSKTP